MTDFADVLFPNQRAMFIAAVLVAVFVALFSSEVMSAPLRGRSTLWCVCLAILTD